MSNSTDEDVQRVLRSRNIGVLESEVESVAKEVSGGHASSGAESSDVERLLVIADEEDDEVGQVAESVTQSGRTPRGFGEIDSEDSSDELETDPVDNLGNENTTRYVSSDNIYVGQCLLMTNEAAF